MVHNNSQDENISSLTEVWPWSMSRELSVRPYFGTYLLPCKVYLDSCTFSFWKVLLKDTEIITSPKANGLAAHVVRLSTLCKPHKREHTALIFPSLPSAL